MEGSPCARCQLGFLEVDEQEGFLLCPNCGFVADEVNLVHNAQGEAGGILVNDNAAGGGGALVPSGDFRRGIGIGLSNKVGKGTKEGLDKLRSTASRLMLSAGMIEEAVSIFKDVKERKLLRVGSEGYSIDAQVAAVLCLVVRTQKQPMSLIEVASACEASPKVVARHFRALVSALHIPALLPSSTIRAFTMRLGAKLLDSLQCSQGSWAQHPYVQESLALADLVSKLGLGEGRSPSLLAAACLLWVAESGTSRKHLPSKAPFAMMLSGAAACNKRILQQLRCALAQKVLQVAVLLPMSSHFTEANLLHYFPLVSSLVHTLASLKRTGACIEFAAWKDSDAFGAAQLPPPPVPALALGPAPPVSTAVPALPAPASTTAQATAPSSPALASVPAPASLRGHAPAAPARAMLSTPAFAPLPLESATAPTMQAHAQAAAASMSVPWPLAPARAQSQGPTQAAPPHASAPPSAPEQTEGSAPASGPAEDAASGLKVRRSSRARRPTDKAMQGLMHTSRGIGSGGKEGVQGLIAQALPDAASAQARLGSDAAVLPGMASAQQAQNTRPAQLMLDAASSQQYTALAQCWQHAFSAQPMHNTAVVQPAPAAAHPPPGTASKSSVQLVPGPPVQPLPGTISAKTIPGRAAIDIVGMQGDQVSACSEGPGGVQGGGSQSHREGPIQDMQGVVVHESTADAMCRDKPSGATQTGTREGQAGALGTNTQGLNAPRIRGQECHRTEQGHQRPLLLGGLACGSTT